MSHNAYTSGRDGTAAGWPTNVAVTPAEFAWFAKGIFESINGDQGGTWAPAAAIIIGGAGVQFATVATSFYGINCTGDAEFHGQTSIIGAVTQIGATSADSFDIYATTLFHNPVSWAGDATFNEDVALAGTGTRTFTIGAAYASTFNGNLFCTAVATLSGGVSIPATTGTSLIVAAPAQFDGGIRQPIQTLTASGAIAAGTRWVIGNIAAGGFATLPATGHPTNAPIEIINSSTETLEVRSPAGSPLILIHGIELTDLARPSATMYYDGSSWVALQWYKVTGV